MSRTKFWYIVAAIIASIMAMLIGNIIYTNHVGNAAVQAGQHAVAESQRQLCTVLIPIDTIYHQSTSTLGKQFAQLFDALVVAYHCPETAPITIPSPSPSPSSPESTR